MSRRVTQQTIAVHKSAVSRALSGRKGVSEHTRSRIIAESRRLGYLHEEDSALGSLHVALISLLRLALRGSTRVGQA